MSNSETRPLLSNALQRIFERRIKRSTAIAIAMICCSAILIIGSIIQAAMTKMTSSSEIKDGSEPFTIRLVYLFIFVGATGLVMLLGGISLLYSFNDPSLRRLSHDHVKKVVWAAVDLHSWAVAGIVTGSLSAIASLIAILAFQNYGKKQAFQFNINETVGWLVIGSASLVAVGVSSAADLDARAVMGRHFGHKNTALTRTAALLQLAFGIVALTISVPLAFTMHDLDGLAIAGIVVSLLAAVFGLMSGRRVARYIREARYHHLTDAEILKFERAWGFSVAAHCLSLLGTGLHAYFAVSIISDCVREDPGKGVFRPSCDSDVGVLAGILPHLFAFFALIMLGITSIIASVRVGNLVEDLTHCEEMPVIINQGSARPTDASLRSSLDAAVC